MRKAHLFLAMVTISVFGVTAASAQSTQPSVAEQAYAGLLVSDDVKAGLPIVGWVLPGPLNGTGFVSPTIRRGDLLVSVNGQKLTTEAYRDLIKKSKPGDELTLLVRKTGGAEGGAMAEAGKGTEEKTVKLVLASKAEWVGPIEFPLPQERHGDPDKVLPGVAAPTPLEKFLREQLAAHTLAEPVDKLLALFTKTVVEKTGFNTLSRVAYTFYRPMRLPELQRAVTSPLGGVCADPRQVFVQAAANLDCVAPALSDAAPLNDPAAALTWLSEHVAASHKHLTKAFVRIGADDWKTLDGDLIHIAVHTDLGEDDPPDVVKRRIGALRLTMAIDFDELLATGGELAGAMVKGKPPAAGVAAVPLPDKLKGIVTGDVLAVKEVDGVTFIYGGPGPNTYKLAGNICVIDAGGDDQYTFAPAKPNEVRLVIDMAGNDKYTGEDAGPACGVFGVDMLIDYDGNDRYECRTHGLGASVAGVGVLMDYGGNDVYVAKSWSEGAAFYGVGALIDLGGSDVYEGGTYTQGVGGPRGFGLLLDQGGDDFYRANGPEESAYGQPAIFFGASQGVGIGVRGYDSGGVGVLADLGGSDRYEAGEFSQGGGYYWGLGILYDANGNDLYFGHRYSQGFGCHQATGILADDSGDDTYWSMVAANQGGAWDIAIGMLIDRAGNDSYRCDGLAQGGAAMQGIAWLIDLDGTDHYVGGGSVGGRSGGNAYHFNETGCYSWSLFLDAGGGNDFYSTGRPNNQTLTPGDANAQDPANSELHGLFIDLPQKLEPAP